VRAAQGLSNDKKDAAEKAGRQPAIKENSELLIHGRDGIPPKLLGAARLRDASARGLNRDGLGAAGARDLMREIGLGREHALGRAGVRVRADVSPGRRASSRQRLQLGGRAARRNLGERPRFVSLGILRHGPGRDRTCDLGIKSPLLYQLSYRPSGLLKRSR
jgi:hypothetical protein